MVSRRQALRVLLGAGDATAVTADSFTFGGKLYRGSFARSEAGAIVNVVDLEEYLYSVVSREMPPGWPASALEAQAICARTYVLARSDPRRNYDLVPSELDQRYDGISGETPAGSAAVQATAGRVLQYGRFFASVAYSSCCGGHTESAADAWGNAMVPYLIGLACPWCTDSPNYRWQRAFAFDALARRLDTVLPALGRLEDLGVAERDGSGRARSLELTSDRGSSFITGAAFRRAVGARVLPSLLLTNVTRTPDAAGVLLEGGGLGHGVGLCQWGARGMALAGRESPEILSFYFAGTNIQSL